jgi:hypothetical protein
MLVFYLAKTDMGRTKVQNSPKQSAHNLRGESGTRRQLGVLKG